MSFTKALFFSISLLLAVSMSAQLKYELRGKIINEKKQPVAFAQISITESSLWAVADEKGFFSIKEVPAGKVGLQVEYLDYNKRVFELNLLSDTAFFELILYRDNLTLDEVAVTAKKGSNNLKTSFVIDRKVLDHMQMLNVKDATSMLPGGRTNTALHLATSSTQNFVVNGGGSEMGRPIFGVGVEIDGVRLSNNANPSTGNGEMVGSDIRSIASSNVESIEIITGIASVEDGDATNGMVKIRTRKGKSPYIVDMVTKPHSKQLALSKGFDLGGRYGVLNVNAEHTRSVSNPVSPYTSYDRNSISLNYSNTYNKHKAQPIFLDMGITGNVGGYNSKSDPDFFVNTYSSIKDNVLRGNLSAKWLLNKKWITNLEISGTVNYNDRKHEVSANKSSPASVAANHATTEGYYIGETYDQNPHAAVLLIAPGHWYELRFEDNRLINYSGRVKANWSHKFGNWNNNLLLGGDYAGSGNMGRGLYYDDIRYAPTWREYRYNEESYTHNYALYAEDRLSIQFNNSSKWMLVAGIRSDITAIKGSEYGTVSNLSPRFNTEYVFWENNKQKTISSLSVKIGWGKTVKLPSFSMLYPRQGYRDIPTFTPGTTPQGETFYAYYTQPTTRLFNPDLRWQHNIQQEISVSMNVKGTKVLLIASQDKTSNPYISSGVYTPFTYKYTDQSDLENSSIPINDRVYSVDRTTGIVTVTDKTGNLPTETLTYREYTPLQGNAKPFNGSPALRKRLSWVIDFKQIAAIKTSFRIDGNFYYYKGVEETIIQDMPNATLLMANRLPYKYVGFYAGSSSYSNGDVSKSINVNFTAITHIPSIRLIFSARIEASLFSYSRILSEYQNNTRGFVIDSRDDYTPSSSKTNIYAGNQFVAVYPEYYISLDDRNTKIPFAEKFMWAKENDIPLYNELAKMVVKTYYNYSFNESRVSPYISSNISVTKEIGEVASVSFNAMNFFNNMATVSNSRPGTSSSLFGSGAIPAFYYGLSLRLKF